MERQVRISNQTRRRLAYAATSLLLLDSGLSRLDAQRPTNSAKDVMLVSIGTPTYDSVRTAVVIPFAFSESFCLGRPHPFQVELQIENLAGKLVGIPFLAASGTSKLGKRLDGTPLDCGNYVAVWPDSSHGGISPRGLRVRAALFVNGERTLGYGGPIR